ncbi:hypothetical protein ACUOA5_39735, partial [Escherichia coli]
MDVLFLHQSEHPSSLRSYDQDDNQSSHTLTFTVDGEALTIKNDFVFAMTGYHPDHSFLTKMGVQIDEETG